MTTDRFIVWMAGRQAAGDVRLQMALLALLVVTWYVCLRLLPEKWQKLGKALFIVSGVITYATVLIFFTWEVYASLVRFG